LRGETQANWTLVNLSFPSLLAANVILTVALIGTTALVRTRDVTD